MRCALELILLPAKQSPRRSQISPGCSRNGWSAIRRNKTAKRVERSIRTGVLPSWGTARSPRLVGVMFST